MSGLTFWTGPANLAQVGPGAVMDGTKGYAYPCVGAEGSPICRDLVYVWRDAEGRRLPYVLRKAGLDPATNPDVFLCAFSAGGPLIRALALHPADRALVRGMLFSDATYSDGWTADHRSMVNPELLELAEASMTSPTRLMVCTSGTSPNYGKPAAAEVLAELLRQLEERYGAFDRVDLGITPAPEWAVRRGNLVLAGYGLTPLYHAGHATTLAASVFERVLKPWYQGGMGLPGATPAVPPVEPPGGGGGTAPPAEPPSSPWWTVGAIGVVVTAAVIIFRLLTDDDNQQH
jgi:hypothetical protein